jgi:hypothetical protein
MTPGGQVELPDCDVVETLKALGRLVDVPQPVQPKPKKGD